MEKIKNALVLSGGSIKGAFQAGAIAEVLNSGFEPDAIYGTSVGSLNGSFLAERAGKAINSGEKPNWKKIGMELESFWREKITSFKWIGKKRNILILLFRILRNNFDGLIDTSPLKKLVGEILKLENLKASPVHFCACAVNIIDGQIMYGTLDDLDILEYIIASTAIPIIMPIQWIGKSPYVDGGIREVAPLKQACKIGAEKIICIVCQPEKLGGVYIKPGNLMEYSEQLMEIVTNELVNNDLRLTEEINEWIRKGVTSGPMAGKREIKIETIRPDKPLSIKLEKFTPQEIDESIQLGHLAAKSVPPNFYL